MRIAWTSGRPILALLIAMAVFTPPALAQSNCAVYAKLALEQQKDNIANKCGFKGPEWNDQYARHIEWCGSVGPAQWKQQIKMRDEKLAACKKR